jgi:hypothetical protein
MQARARFSWALVATFGVVAIAPAQPDFSRPDWSTLMSGTSRTVLGRGMVELDNPLALESYYRRLTGQAIGPRFAIEWTKYKVIAITAGERGSRGGRRTFVRDVRRLPGGRTVITAVDFSDFVGPQPRGNGNGGWQSGNSGNGSGWQNGDGSTGGWHEGNGGRPGAGGSPFTLIRLERGAHHPSVTWTEGQAAGNSWGNPGWGNPGWGNPGWGGGAWPYPWPYGPFDCDPFAPRIGFTVLQTGGMCQWNQSGFRVANNDAELAALMISLFGNIHQSRINCDWNRHRIVAISLGRQNTGGFGLSIPQVVGVGHGALVCAQVTVPMGGVVTQALTAPYALVRVDRTVPINVQFRVLK